MESARADQEGFRRLLRRVAHRTPRKRGALESSRAPVFAGAVLAAAGARANPPTGKRPRAEAPAALNRAVHRRLQSQSGISRRRPSSSTIAAPGFNDGAGLQHASEPALIEAFVAQAICRVGAAPCAEWFLSAYKNPASSGRSRLLLPIISICIARF